MPTPKIYMAVTADKLELPIFVGTSVEVAAWAGITLQALYSQVSLKRSGNIAGRKFVVVDEVEQ